MVSCFSCLFEPGRRILISFDATIKEYLKQIDRSPLLTAKQEQELGWLIMEKNDPKAREQLVASNLRLVVNIAKRYSGRGMSLGDLIEEGNLGLIRAVDYFDPRHGTRFSTYAAWWIKQSIKRSLLTNVPPVHIPTYMVSLMNQWRHTVAELENRLGRTPDVKEMSEIMHMPSRKAKIIHHIVGVVSSMRDNSVDDDKGEKGNKLEATLADKWGDMPGDEMVDDEEKKKVLRLLEEIDSREAEVLKLHYGLDGKRPLTLKEIGKKLNLTRERIRQIQRAALTQLYGYMNAE